MRTLTTAINEGEHKVPGESHKAARFALAPGDAAVISDPERRYRVIDKDAARRAQYRWIDSWLEGRAVAEFDLDGEIVAQPIKDDPKERKRASKRDPEAVEGRPEPDHTEPGGRGVPVPALLPPARRRGAVSVQAEAPSRKGRKPRKEKAPLEWL
jgi:hypothetical protein